MSNGFPKDFLWGAASAAAQVEGGWNEGGRTPSIWDIAPSNKIKYGDNCHVACDHYHRYKEDVAIMKELGLKSYRFSLSWSRIVPREGEINPEGIAFYNNLIDELISAGIEPLVTIFHWDLPVWVQEKGGWMSSKIVPLYEEYTKVVVEAFSDRVTYWMTMNEPQCFILNGHTQGAHAPFKRNYMAISKLTRNCMLCHGIAVKTIRKYAIKTPKVGIAMATGAYVPKDESEESIEYARKQSLEEGLGLMGVKWWYDPMILGKPTTAFKVFRSKEKDMKDICQPLDFIGINVYAPNNYADWGGDSSLSQTGLPRTSIGWVVDERVMYWAVRFISEKYKLPIMITENGIALNDYKCLDGKVHDPQRTDYLYRYLGNLKRAITEGYPVIGYQHWSIMDNFEWAEGYDPRFGLIFVDYETGERTMKDSAYEYQKIIESNGEIIN